jgi:hypothetical protein
VGRVVDRAQDRRIPAEYGIEFSEGDEPGVRLKSAGSRQAGRSD